MDTKRGGEFGAWHELFNALCDRRGWYDNTHLASALCAHAGKHTREDFEAAKKKLRAWRSGRRLPLRRNLAAIAQLLDVDDEPELERQWQALYRRARETETCLDGPGTAASSEPAPPMMTWRVGGWVLAAVATAFGSGLLLTAVAGSRQAEFRDLPIVSFEGHVRVPLGKSHLIHGAYGTCGGPPPAWDEIADTVPTTPLGIFADGGLARKAVRACRKEKAVRAISFTGLKAGTDEIGLLGDYIKVDVVAVTLKQH